MHYTYIVSMTCKKDAKFDEFHYGNKRQALKSILEFIITTTSLPLEPTSIDDNSHITKIWTCHQRTTSTLTQHDQNITGTLRIH